MSARGDGNGSAAAPEASIATSVNAAMPIVRTTMIAAPIDAAKRRGRRIGDQARRRDFREVGSKDPLGQKPRYRVDVQAGHRRPTRLKSARVTVRRRATMGPWSTPP